MLQRMNAPSSLAGSMMADCRPMIYVSGGMSVMPVLWDWTLRRFLLSVPRKAMSRARRNESWRVGVPA